MGVVLLPWVEEAVVSPQVLEIWQWGLRDLVSVLSTPHVCFAPVGEEGEEGCLSESEQRGVHLLSQ